MKKITAIAAAAALLLTACTSRDARRESIAPGTDQTSEVITSAETVSETGAETGQGLFVTGDMTWQEGYRHFLLSGGYRTENYAFSSRNEDTYFALIDLLAEDGEDIPELAVFREGYCYSIFHWSEGDGDTYPHVCRLLKLPFNGWSGDGIDYLPGQDIVLYLDANRLTMHGYARYDVYTGDPGQGCFYDHTYETIPFVIYINDAPEPMTREEYDAQREAVRQYGITNEGEKLILGDSWVRLDQSSPDARIINEENIAVVLGE